MSLARPQVGAIMPSRARSCRPCRAASHGGLSRPESTDQQGTVRESRGTSGGTRRTRLTSRSIARGSSRSSARSCYTPPPLRDKPEWPQVFHSASDGRHGPRLDCSCQALGAERPVPIPQQEIRDRLFGAHAVAQHTADQSSVPGRLRVRLLRDSRCATRAAPGAHGGPFLS